VAPKLDALVGLFDVVGANIRCVDSDVNFLCDDLTSGTTVLDGS
jgi:hypothetical protein